MTLPAFVKNLNDVAEAFRAEYIKTDDGFVLDTDDKTFKSKIDEFRTNNIARAKKIEDLEATMKKFEGIDPAKYQEAQAAVAKLRELEEKKLIDAGDLDKVVQQRTEQMRTEYQAQSQRQADALKKREEEAASLRSQLGSHLIDSAVNDAISKIGQVRKGALEDVRNRARSVFKINEKGEMVPITTDGRGYDGDGQPLTPDTFAKRLLENASYLFEPSQGGGGGGGDRGGKRPEGQKTIRGDDPIEFGKNLEDIAKGKVLVQAEE